MTKNKFKEYRDVVSIIIIFKPILKSLKKILKGHQKNFSTTIVVNNSPEIFLDSFQSPQVKIINNPHNIGLAAALNIGISEAKKQGAKMVALFDQDTSIDNSFNKKMISNINLFFDKKFALYSPICFNKNINDYLPHYFIYPLSLKRVKPNLKNKISFPDFVITSGSYINLDLIEDIGQMDENLFINYIDIEWCLRARSKGFQIASFSNCSITHNIGDYSISVFNQKYPIHTPLRMYYTFRNSLYCYSLKHISLSWKLIDFLRNIPRFLFYMLFVKNRPTYFKYIIKGYYHGLIKKMGKLEE